MRSGSGHWHRNERPVLDCARPCAFCTTRRPRRTRCRSTGPRRHAPAWRTEDPSRPPPPARTQHTTRRGDVPRTPGVDNRRKRQEERRSGLAAAVPALKQCCLPHKSRTSAEVFEGYRDIRGVFDRIYGQGFLAKYQSIRYTVETIPICIPPVGITIYRDRAVTHVEDNDKLWPFAATHGTSRYCVTASRASRLRASRRRQIPSASPSGTPQRICRGSRGHRTHTGPCSTCRAGSASWDSRPAARSTS